MSEKPVLTTSFGQKIILLMFGILLFLVLLEAGLRFGGFAVLFMQEHRNMQKIKEKGVYRVMCLGESTTQGQYPKFLEEVLNQHKTGVRFRVIDKGVGGTTTTIILNRVESYIDEYHPDLVVAMMGINDYGEHIPYEGFSTSKLTLFLKSFRTYKLTRLLWLHILVKLKEIGLYKPAENDYTYTGLGHAPRSQGKLSKSEDELQKAIDLNPGNEQAYIGLGWLYRDQNKISRSEAAFRKAIDLNPKNDGAYTGLGFIYRDQGKFSLAADALKKAIDLNPGNEQAYIGLGWLYRDQNKISHSEAAFKKAVDLNFGDGNVLIELGFFYRDQGRFSEAEAAFKTVGSLNPNNVNAYIGLGWLYFDQGKLSQSENEFKKAVDLNPADDRAFIGLGQVYRNQHRLFDSESAFRKAIDLKPKNDSAYIGLGRIYRDQGKYSESEGSFQKAIDLNPNNEYAHIALGCLYQFQGKFLQAEEALKKAADLIPQSDSVCGAISVLYEAMGKPELAKRYAEEAVKLRSTYNSTITVSNYRKLKAILDKRRVPLICVQYPMRNIDPLKKIFEEDKRVVFVDNEASFKEIIEKRGLKEVFVDMFGGDFGHCTEKGNRLLAKNIANVIFKKMFHK